MQNGRKKEHVTPEKMLVFEKMFHQRVDLKTTSDDERVDRKSKLNKHIKEALKNISRSEEIQTTEEEIRRNIAEI